MLSKSSSELSEKLPGRRSCLSPDSYNNENDMFNLSLFNSIDILAAHPSGTRPKDVHYKAPEPCTVL